MSETQWEATRSALAQSICLLAAVGEAGSFSGAAERLAIDPSAVSHRIRNLENVLATRLFDRTTRHVRPTRTGVLLCESAQRVLEELDRTMTAVRALRGSSAIRLSVHSSLALKWLIPRLPEAERAGIDLSIDVREELIDPRRSDMDAGLRFGPGPYPGLHSTKLAGCRLQPVVSPRHELARRRTIDLARDTSITLLGDVGAERHVTGTTWADYFRRLGDGSPEGHAVKRFDRADLMLQGAIGGMGVALGRSLLIEDDIRQGLLVPIGESVSVDSAYWLVGSPEVAESEGFDSLRAWLHRQTVGVP